MVTVIVPVEPKATLNEDTVLALGIVGRVTVVLDTEPPVIYVELDAPLSQVPANVMDFVPSAL